MSAEQLARLLASEEAFTAFVQAQAANAHIVQVLGVTKQACVGVTARFQSMQVPWCAHLHVAQGART